MHSRFVKHGSRRRPDREGPAACPRARFVPPPGAEVQGAEGAQRKRRRGAGRGSPVGAQWRSTLLQPAGGALTLVWRCAGAVLGQKSCPSRRRGIRFALAAAALAPVSPGGG